MSSSTPVTVTVRAVFHVVPVNVRLPGAAVPSLPSWLATVTGTATLGALCNATVNVAVPPPSVVLPDAMPRSNPPSSSRTVTVTLTAASEVGYDVASPLPCTACDSVTVSLSTSASSAAVAVTVCAVFQVVPVNVRSRCCGVASVSTSTAASPLVTRTVTGPSGCAFNRTV